MALIAAMLPHYQMLEAIKRGRVDEFNHAVERGASVRSQDLNGHSVFELAVRSGQPTVLRELLQSTADANQAVGKRGDYLIHLATRLSDIGCLAVLLENGAYVDSLGHYRRTPLHLASKLGGEYMAQLLFDHQANPDATDALGNTPLHIASERGDRVMVKLMLKNNASALITNNQLYTPIHEAAANGHTDIAKRLLSHEQAVNPGKLDPLFVDRIQKVAERHGQMETASAIAEKTDSVASSTPETHFRRG